MPTYDFRCQKCAIQFSRSFHFEDDLTTVTCPNGHRQAQRLYAAPAVVFKGHGYYVTDNRSSSKSTSSQ